MVKKYLFCFKCKYIHNIITKEDDFIFMCNRLHKEHIEHIGDITDIMSDNEIKINILCDTLYRVIMKDNLQIYYECTPDGILSGTYHYMKYEENSAFSVTNPKWANDGKFIEPDIESSDEKCD